MRAPWTVLRDTNAELRRERDERAELIALRKERIVLRTVLWVGYAGMLLVIGWGAAGSEPPMSGSRSVGAILAVLTVTLMAGGIAMAVAHNRHGESDSPGGSGPTRPAPCSSFRSSCHSPRRSTGS